MSASPAMAQLSAPNDPVFSGNAAEICAATLALHSKSFALAGRLLPRESRRDAAVLYTYCRLADDAIDLVDPAAQGAALSELRRALASVYRGNHKDVRLKAFQELVQRKAVPRQYPEELLAGFEMDTVGTRYQTLEELLLYCHRVAGVVGLMMCHVLGVKDARALKNAAHLGIAMQLTNICRDIAEDWRLGRLYLPLSMVQKYSPGALDGPRPGPLPQSLRGALTTVTKQLLAHADRFYRSGDAGIPALPWRAAFAVRAARSIYSAIGARILRPDYDALTMRAVVPNSHKLALVARAALATFVELPRRWFSSRSVRSWFLFRGFRMISFPSEVAVYVGRVRQFERIDWIVYIAWVGLMLGLVFSTGGFLLVGNAHGVRFPAVAWWVPVGAIVFTISIAIDTIGHRTIYKAEISGAEGLVHGITILCGISSCVLLCLAYQLEHVWIPALVLTVLSLLYSLIDEAFHWRRYVRKFSDRVEMWSHVGILAGHSTMMVAWWVWFFQGYGGVPQTIAALGALT